MTKISDGSREEKGMDQATEAESSENVSELKVLDIPVDENIEIPDTGSPNQVIKELEEYFDDIEEVYPWGNPSDKFLKNDFFDFSYLDDYDEVERYWVDKPYAYVSILRDEDKRDNIYYVVEPYLDEFEEFVSALYSVDLERSDGNEVYFPDLVEHLVENYPNVFLNMMCSGRSRDKARRMMENGRRDEIYENEDVWRDLVRNNVLFNFTGHLKHMGILLAETSSHSGAMSEYIPEEKPWILSE